MNGAYSPEGEMTLGPLTQSIKMLRQLVDDFWNSAGRRASCRLPFVVGQDRRHDLKWRPQVELSELVRFVGFYLR